MELDTRPFCELVTDAFAQLAAQMAATQNAMRALGPALDELWWEMLTKPQRRRYCKRLIREAVTARRNTV